MPCQEQFDVVSHGLPAEVEADDPGAELLTARADAPVNDSILVFDEDYGRLRKKIVKY